MKYTSHLSYIKSLLLSLLTFLFIGTAANAQSLIHLSDATGISISASEEAELQTAADSLIAALPVAFRDSFKVYDCGFYLQQEHYIGGYLDVFGKLVEEAGAQSKYYLVVGKGLLADGSVKMRIGLKLPQYSNFFCLTDEKLFNVGQYIQATANRDYSLSSAQRELAALLRCKDYLHKIIDCECSDIREESCANIKTYKDIDDELITLGFRKLEVEVGDSCTLSNLSPDIYDYFGKQVKIDGQFYCIGEQLVEGIQLMTNCDSCGKSLKVYILDNESWVNGEWEVAKQATESIKVVEFWVIIHDVVSEKTYLYTNYTIGPITTEIPIYTAIGENNNRSGAVPGWGDVMKLSATVAIDVTLQAVGNYVFTNDDWSQAWLNVSYSAALTDAFFDVIKTYVPMKVKLSGTQEKILKAGASALGYVVEKYNADKTNYTIEQASADFIKQFGTVALTDYLIGKCEQLKLKEKLILGVVKLKTYFKSNPTITEVVNGTMSKCIGYLGCFIKDTPILMANNNPFKIPTLAYSMALLPIVSPIQNVQPDDLVKSYHHEQSYYATADNNKDVFVPGSDQIVSIENRDWSDTKSLQNAGTETNWISASAKANRSGKYLDYDLIHITPKTWQIGTFEIIEPTGSKVEVEANRPKTWYKENNVNGIGDKAWFYMPEIGINGEATLLSIRPTIINTTNFALNDSSLSRSSSNGSMVDRPVITTFKRFAPVVYDYHFSDGSIIGATPEHPFFSIDRNSYIAVGELQLGEQVMTAGQKVVKFIAGKQREKGEPVYNFEVWREHNYYVGSKESGEWLLVHNSCDGFWNKTLKYGTGWELPIDHIWRGHSFANKVPGKTYFGQLMTKDKIKDLVNEMLKDPSVQWQDIGGQLRALVDGSKYPGFPSSIGHDYNGNILNTIRVIVVQDGKDIVIKNAFPSININ